MELGLTVRLHIKATVNDPREIDAELDQTTHDLHGLSGCVGIFEYSRVMDNTCIQALCNTAADQFRI